MRHTHRRLLTKALPGSALLTALVLFSACSSDDDSDDTDSGSEDDSTTQEVLEPSDFLSDALAAEMTVEPCTLSGGTETECYRITVVGAPVDHSVGPFCPRNLSDTEQDVGIWLDGSGQVYDLTGEFIRGLDDLYGGTYGDGAWLFYDEASGAVNYTATQEACEAAARPDVDEQYQNHCVECLPEYYTDLEEMTFLIPIQPVPAASTVEIEFRGKVGVTLNGVELDPPAPVTEILGARTIAAFDDCGGHVNPAGGYHYHAALGCSESVVQEDGHSGKFGYAMDGYAIYAQLDGEGVEPGDLDECRGHFDSVRGYHYHAASPGENMFLGCFRGETGSVDGEDEGGPMGPPGAGG
ncbi:MAG: YHYH protein [Myxococcota bacterium]